MPEPDAQPTDPTDPAGSRGAEARPRHVGIIMDGNGRWAQRKGLPRIEGHRLGADSVRDITRAARELGIEALTLYAFSSQNWQRPVDEVAGLMQLLHDYLIGERAEILDNSIRLEAIGDVEKLPPLVRQPLDELRSVSAANRGMTLTLALSYGGRESIARAVKAAVRDAVAGRLSPDAVDTEAFNAYLPTAKLPPLDLLIRTSGEQRISNFMLWEIAYAELIFVDVLWPEFRRQHLHQCLAQYAARERRFGLTSDQLVSDVESL